MGYTAVIVHENFWKGTMRKETADIILMHFEPDTKSPITLLELGLFARSDKLWVHCPEGFWRKGNVDIVCEHYGIKQVRSLESLIRVLTKIGTPNPNRAARVLERIGRELHGIAFNLESPNRAPDG